VPTRLEPGREAPATEVLVEHNPHGCSDDSSLDLGGHSMPRARR
jgi:hypothetical protein